MSETLVIVYTWNESARLSEPPILPNSNQPSSENPFAPSFVGTEVDRSPGKSHLDSSYWIAFAALLVSSIVISLIGFPLGWAGVIASVSAAVRVPLLQRRHSMDVTEFASARADLPSPLALLFTSLALNIVFFVVSFIAFAAVCIPGTMAFGFASYSVVSISGIIGLICFCMMFIFSLRLRF